MVKLKQNDWEVLFPAEYYPLGSTKLEIRPLSVNKLPEVVRDIKKIIEALSKSDITLGTASDNIATLVKIVVSEAPGLISVMSGLDAEDVGNLPMSIAIDLATKCMQVNIADQESLIKNLTALVEMMAATLTTSKIILEN